MKNYELTYLISGKLAEEEAKEIHNKMGSLIQTLEGLLKDSSRLNKVKLAYPVEKEADAYLGTLIFEALPEKAPAIEKELKKDEAILRHLLLFKPPVKLSPRRIRKTPPAARKAEETGQPKVELKKLEKKLEEILNE
jgi:ribosomal protein S6